MSLSGRKRDRLISVIRNYCDDFGITIDNTDLYVNVETLADYLIANGVDISPVKLIEPTEKVDLSFYESKGFDKKQLEEITLGLQAGLNSEQLDLYADLRFNHYQMREARVGFMNGLAMDQVSVYLNPVFRESQMNVIRVAFELGMSHAEVSEFANPSYSWEEMYRIRTQMRASAREGDSLNDIIRNAEAQSHSSGAPIHYKQEGFEI